MRIEKRTLARYILLNCLTLGIYGFVVAQQMDREINALCKGDRQQPGVKYAVAWLIAKLPIVGAIYYNYWWYQQANRLKLNANRYGLTVKESGTDVFLMRTILEAPLAVFTVFSVVGALLIPALICLLFLLFAPVAGLVILGLCALVLLLFCNEISAGAIFSVYYMMKNLNRFADVARNGAEEFDPMAYEYYPAAAVKYPQLLQGAPDGGKNPPPPPPPPPFGGYLVGLNGTCAGYEFELTSGEEIVIGKDATVSQVVIDPAYKEISRKHVGVSYDIIRNQFRVVDYSSNGTWANGMKLTRGQEMYLPHGTELKLANDKNKFLLK